MAWIRHPYTLWSGGSRWLLQFDAGCPGLRVADGRRTTYWLLKAWPLLAALTPRALSQRSLSGVERVGRRVEARFAPADWGGLQVVASWSPAPVADGIDLEIEVVASSVGELKSVEVIVSTQIEGPETSKTEPSRLWVQPRDARSAGLSYDGREPASVLGRLTTGPVPVTMEPATFRGCDVWTAGRKREPVSRACPSPRRRPAGHRRRCSSRIVAGRGFRSVIACSAMIWKKGSSVRGRLRGIWISHRDAEELGRGRVRTVHRGTAPPGALTASGGFGSAPCPGPVR